MDMIARLALIALIFVLMLCVLFGCAQQHAVTAEGAVLTGIPAQAVEQCKAQPDSAWCKP